MARRDVTECGNCIFYDPYPCSDHCKHYDTFPQHITRCEWRTTNLEGRINDAGNPLIMKRELRYNEVWHNGRVRCYNHSLYNPNGIFKSEANNIDDEGNECKN
jgi:hypothetical protein